VGTPKSGQEPTIAALGSGGPIPTPPKGKPATSNKKTTGSTEEVLNSSLPPRQWSEGGQLWQQCVSCTPATRLDVLNLEEELDTRLQQRQARETGICPVRRELYSQCFGKTVANNNNNNNHHHHFIKKQAMVLEITGDFLT